MLSIYYLSGDQSSKIDFTSWPYWMQTGDFADYEKSYTETQNRIMEIKNVPKERYLTISVCGSNEQEYYDNLNRLHDVFEKDVMDMTPGRLYFQKSYLLCYVLASRKTEWENTDCMLDNEIRIVPTYPFWITEQAFTFLPASVSGDGSGSDALEFPFDFPFDFISSGNGTERRTVNHYAPSHFKMTVYGPCVNPRITVNGYPYQVFTMLEANEYMVINSRDNTITKYLVNGTTENLYNSRQFEPSIFEKIPGENLAFDWPGTFGFDITLFLERSEPKWK